MPPEESEVDQDSKMELEQHPEGDGVLNADATWRNSRRDEHCDGGG